MISVIIPTYNRAGTLFDAAQSVLNQTYKNIELIIVDDGSTDNTDEVVAMLNGDRIKYIKLEKNMGACAARNRGIDVSEGEYIAFHDSDDIWHNDKLEKQLAFLQMKKADIVFAAIERYPWKGDVPTHFPYTDPSELNTKEDMFKDLLKENTVSMVTVLCKRECVIKVRFDETLPRRQDWDWAMRAAQQYSMYYQNIVLVDSYAQADSISYSSEKHVRALQIIQKKYERIIAEDKVLSAQWAERIASALFSAGMPADKACLQAFLRTGKLKHLIKSAMCVFKLQRIYLQRGKK